MRHRVCADYDEVIIQTNHFMALCVYMSSTTAQRSPGRLRVAGNTWEEAAARLSPCCSPRRQTRRPARENFSTTTVVSSVFALAPLDLGKTQKHLVLSPSLLFRTKFYFKLKGDK